MATEGKKNLIDIVLGEAPLEPAEINKEGLLLNFHTQSGSLLFTGKHIQQYRPCTY